MYGSSPSVPDLIIKSGTPYRVIADHLGSPRLVVNATNGAVAQRMRHDEWGNVLEDTAAGFTPFGFAGGIYDPDTGLVRFGARDCDPAIGRWTAKDPIRWFGGQTNLYVYVDHDPVNRVDGTGLGWVTNNTKDTIWIRDEDGGVVPLGPGESRKADGVFNSGFSGSSPDDFFRKINDATDVTVEPGSDGLELDFNGLADRVADLDPGTGWKDEDWFGRNFRNDTLECSWP